MADLDPKFVKDGIEALRRSRAKAKMQMPTFNNTPVSPDGEWEMKNNPSTPFALPTFSEDLAASPDGQWVSMLSSPSIPTCSSRGTGTEYGKLTEIQISATTDNISWQYNGTFYTDEVVFGDITPAA